MQCALGHESGLDNLRSMAITIVTPNRYVEESNTQVSESNWNVPLAPSGVN